MHAPLAQAQPWPSALPLAPAWTLRAFSEGLATTPAEAREAKFTFVLPQRENSDPERENSDPGGSVEWDMQFSCKPEHVTQEM